MRIFRNILGLTLLSLGSWGAWAQGCSDAGFCTMGAMRPNQGRPRALALRLRSLEIGYNQGYTDRQVTISTAYADFNFSLLPWLTAQVKLPYLSSEGHLGSASGLSDISYSFTSPLWHDEERVLSFTLGGKIPSNGANAKAEDGRPLPMYYQTSLGTYDIVAGLSWASPRWLLAIGYQRPLNQNDNTFVWGAWRSSTETLVANSYPVSNRLKRGDDVMLRVEYNLRFSRWNVFAGLLPIYRLHRDQIQAPATGVLTEVNGSDGLVVNGLVGGGYMFTASTGMKFLWAQQLEKRDLNPDGLARAAVWNLSLSHQF